MNSLHCRESLFCYFSTILVTFAILDVWLFVIGNEILATFAILLTIFAGKLLDKRRDEMDIRLSHNLAMDIHIAIHSQPCFHDYLAPKVLFQIKMLKSRQIFLSLAR